jgi:signal transduction histidine kinase
LAEQAIRSILNIQNPAAPASVYVEQLDLNNFAGPQYEQILRGYLREKYQDKPIGVIVALGSAALEMQLRFHEDLWPQIPVVFTAVDEATAARLKFPSDVTGSTMRLRFADVVTAAESLVPNFKRIVLVGSPLAKSPYRRHIIQELPNYETRLEYIDASVLTMAEIRQRVATLPADAVIYYTSISEDAAGIVYTPRDALTLVAQVANRPIIVDAETSIGRGAAGGFVLDPVAVGEEAGRRVLRILNGESASSIPITAGSFAKPIFDWKQLKKWNVDEAALPPGSEVRFRPATMWEQYSSQLTIIFAALLLQTALIVWLLFERHRRRSAELESRSRLREVIHLDRVAAVGAMSASIAHELNQPLATILTNAEAAEMLLAKKPIDHDQLRDILADIVKSDQRAGDIIAHMRGLLKKPTEFEGKVFDLNDAIRDADHTLGPAAKKRGVVVSTFLAQGPLPVHADQVHLEQAILNLATNAMDAMESRPPGSRKMVLQTALIGDSEVEVSVSDSGAGILIDRLDGVFDTFYTTKKNGIGLGLSIVRTIVEAAGGKIWAENRGERGAVFRFTLPLAKTELA